MYFIMCQRMFFVGAVFIVVLFLVINSSFGCNVLLSLCVLM